MSNKEIGLFVKKDNTGIESGLFIKRCGIQIIAFNRLLTITISWWHVLYISWIRHDLTGWELHLIPWGFHKLKLG